MPHKQKNSLREKIYSIVRGIPRGETRSYKEVAESAGLPNHARYVGYLMSINYDETIPCHRVIRHGGEVGKYNRGGEDIKHQILEREGWNGANKAMV